MAKSKIMPIGSPVSSRRNLATPDSSIPLRTRLISFTSRLTCLESCHEERINAMSEQINVAKTPKKKDDVVSIFCPPFTDSLKAFDEYAVLYMLPGQEDQGPRLGLCCNEGRCKECPYRVDPPLLLERRQI